MTWHRRISQTLAPAPPPNPVRPSGATGAQAADRALGRDLHPRDFGVLVVLVSMTSWPTRLFAFADHVCLSDDCPPVPYGVNYYIYPVMWGGIGAAVAAAVLGPFVSMVKGWYMSFWPIITIAVITLTSVAGYAMTGFSERYWR